MSTRLTKTRVAVALGLVLLFIGVRRAIPLAASWLEAPMPSRAELVAMIAVDENVSADRISLHVVDTTKDLPYVMYSVKGVPKPAPVDRLPVVYRALIHPDMRPWEWVVGGGARSNVRDPETAVSLGFTTADGDTRSDVNTVLFGESAPEAAKLTISVRGKTYVRDLHQSGGYLILLGEKGVSPGDIQAFHVLDEQGNELPVPRQAS